MTFLSVKLCCGDSIITENRGSLFFILKNSVTLEIEAFNKKRGVSY